MKYEYRLTEEIARWVFEVHVGQLSGWQIAFVNPTAGPWKRLMGRDAGDVPGEVHRFEREERRPDLVIVSDELKILVVIEAKDAIEQLLRPVQVTKSASVVNELTEILRGRSDNLYWGKRADYLSMGGLLWATETEASLEMRTAAFNAYLEELDTSSGLVSDVMLGIECHRTPDGVGCRGYVSETKALPIGIGTDALLESLRFD